ncbi:MAG TPA: hypothetical protein VJ888_09460 [Mobilitalea sp.]|nr:hypothetical protein [Mobilitalea sp.]
MKKRLNPMFFGLCFLAALLAESYCLVGLEAELFSTVGIGIVVLILGYLLLDSIRDHLGQKRKKDKFYLEKLYSEETEKWNERYTELLNLHKATYAAVKKNTVAVNNRFEELLQMLNSSEKNTEGSLAKITELQKKALEGQTKALNIQVNYNKENAKLLITEFQKEISKLDHNEQLSLILSVLQEKQPALMGDNIKDEYEENNYKENNYIGENYIEEDCIEEDSIEEVKDAGIGGIEADWSQGADTVSDNNYSEDLWQEEEGQGNEIEEPLLEEEEQVVVPIYDDPNKALTADEIASLFASFGK